MQHHLIGMIFLKVVFMAQGKRNRLSADQRADMWRRWKAGESLQEIGRGFGKGHGSIRFLLTQRGGIVPAVRRRSPRTLTPAEREDISRGIASGSSIREIAKERCASINVRENPWALRLPQVNSKPVLQAAGDVFAHRGNSKTVAPQRWPDWERRVSLV